MNIREKYTLEIGNIERLIDELQKGNVREKDNVPGMPTCHTLGTKLSEAFETLLRKIETDARGDIQIAADHIEH